MDQRHFDELAKEVGDPPPSRRVWHIVGAAVLGATLVGSRPRPARAGVCEERVPKRGYEPESNGCGPKGGPKFPNRIWGADFKPGCDQHDICYGTCNSSKLGCDTDFFLTLNIACEAVAPGESRFHIFTDCSSIADYCAAAVVIGGGDAYEAAQADACTCCNTESAGEKCGDRCCSPGTSCCNPGRSLCCLSDDQVCCNGRCAATAHGPYEERDDGVTCCGHGQHCGTANGFPACVG